MGTKLAVAVALLLVSIPTVAQVQPSAEVPKAKGALERRRGNGLLVGRLAEWGNQQVGASRLGYRNDVALPRDQCGGPLHDLGRQRHCFQLQALRR